ncbi:MAG: Na/Pi cotransporter family protein, partial [bacterium]
MTTKMLLDMLFHLIGGLGIFLFGMKSMSDGLQAVAGNTLRRMIALVTDNRLMAVAAGIGLTCLVQSSSITTVIAVGFVNSGFMMLNQAMGVILGANIGTTITGWVLVLKIGKYGLPIVGVAVFFYLFSKNEKVKYIALTALGLGMIFFGLELMKNGFKPLRGMDEFKNWFLAFDSETYLGVLKTAAVGCILTVMVQSSSATLGITIGLAQTGLIGFETAAALVLGENIGTTITAYLASIGASTNAKRAAYFHV